jgi:hypothetical protein
MPKITPPPKAQFNPAHIAEVSGVNRAKYLAEMRAHIARQWEEYNIDARLAIPYKQIVTDCRVISKKPHVASVPKSWAKSKKS